MTSEESAVLSHQLQGIMECWDMTNLFYLLKMPTLYRCQRKRLPWLISTYDKTSTKLMDTYGELVETPYTFKSLLEYPVNSKSTALLNRVLDAWVDWGSKGKELYTALDGYYWKKLYWDIQHDLNTAQHLHDKFSTPNKTIRMEMKAKLNAARNATV